MTLEAMERFVIADALRRHNGNRAAAARQLGINPARFSVSSSRWELTSQQSEKDAG